MHLNQDQFRAPAHLQARSLGSGSASYLGSVLRLVLRFKISLIILGMQVPSNSKPQNIHENTYTKRSFPPRTKNHNKLQNRNAAYPDLSSLVFQTLKKI